jgi:hypothetical protein
MSSELELQRKNLGFIVEVPTQTSDTLSFQSGNGSYDTCIVFIVDFRPSTFLQSNMICIEIDPEKKLYYNDDYCIVFDASSLTPYKLYRKPTAFEAK